jgi:hypothetical protein
MILSADQATLHGLGGVWMLPPLSPIVGSAVIAMFAVVLGALVNQGLNGRSLRISHEMGLERDRQTHSLAVRAQSFQQARDTLSAMMFSGDILLDIARSMSADRIGSSGSDPISAMHREELRAAVEGYGRGLSSLRIRNDVAACIVCGETFFGEVREYIAHDRSVPIARVEAAYAELVESAKQYLTDVEALMPVGDRTGLQSSRTGAPIVENKRT